VYAVGTASAMVEWQRENTPAELLDRIHPVLGGETTIPLDDASADLAVMMNVHHELADPVASYREALRVLRDGGQLLVVDWLPGVPGEGPEDEVRVAPEMIAAVIASAGFGDVEIGEGFEKHSLITAVKPASR
ncbi:MAG: class I SAM-dependent methyltransferase, partial [Actinobacteria bacterium]